MYREISATKIREKRGERSRKAVVEAVDCQVTEQDLWAYENKKWKPSQKKLKYLLVALNATYDEISEPVELALS